MSYGKIKYYNNDVTVPLAQCLQGLNAKLVNP